MNVVSGLNEITEAVQHLFFPHVCKGCNSDLLALNDHLCIQCLLDLPYTSFERKINNPVEKSFWGRCSIESAMSLLYFTPASLVQRIVHHIKYKGEKELNIMMGRLIGLAIAETDRFSHTDIIVPIPLHPKKLKKRGYNQAELLAEGIAQILGLPVQTNLLSKTISTETQTHKNRFERWENVDGLFSCNSAYLDNTKGILLVDDVMTTGATIEACCKTIFEISSPKISIATLAFAAR